MKKSQKYAAIFVILCLTGLAFRLLTLDVPFYDDSGSMPMLEKYYDRIYSNIVMAPHGPLDTLFFFISPRIFGTSTEGYRFMLFLFSAAYTILLYIFTKKMFGKETACYSVFLSLFAFLAYYNYFIMDLDGIIMALFSLISIFSLQLFLESRGFNCFYYENNQKEHRKGTGKITTSSTKKQRGLFWLALSIFIFALLVSMKQRSMIIIIPIFLYAWFTTKKLKKAVFYSAMYVSFAILALAVVFALFYAVYHEMAPYLIQVILGHNASLSTDIIYNITHPIRPLIHLSITLTPLLYLLPLLSFKRWNRHFLFYSWALISLIIAIVLPRGLFTAKFVSGHLLTPLIVLSAEAITQQKIRKSLIFPSLIATAIVSALLIHINNTFASDYWFYMTEIGPIVKIWQPIIYFIFAATFLLFLAVIAKPRPIIKTYAFLALIVIALSFNILMITDNIVDRTHNEIIQEIKKYESQNNLKSSGPVYSWNEDIAFYLGNIGFYVPPEGEVYPDGEFDANKYLRDYSRSIGFGEQGYIDLDIPIDKIEYFISKKGGTVFLLNYPYKYVVKKYPLHQEKIAVIEKYCAKEKEKIYKTATLVIYKCEGA